MFHKIMLITLAAVFLGGCSLSTYFGNKAATDDQSGQVVMSPVPTPDPELETMPSPATGTDQTSLETDISATTILDEDFSDLN